MEDKESASWERFLNPDALRTNLIVASLFIAAFEMLRDSIIGRIRDFFTDGFEDRSWIISKDYESKVLSLNKSPLYASLTWLKGMAVLDESDIEDFDKLRMCRNEIVHEMGSYISQGPKIDPLPLFTKMTDLLYKIEKWWILNVEVPTNPDFVGKDIDEDSIVPGKMMAFRLLANIALSSDEESKIYYEELMKRKRSM